MRFAPLALVLILLAAVALATSPAGAAPPEVRGTWLTTTGNDALASPGHTASTMRRLRSIGLNTVYVECWKNGYTEFSSLTLQQTIGVTHKINIPGQPASRDLLGETVIEAHRNGLLHVAWFEYGFMAAMKETQNELRTKKPQWLLRDKAGSEVAPDGMVWMSPANPEVREFLIGILLDAAMHYDIDGIQLDDRLAWPDKSMGYDEATRRVYAQENGGSQVPENENDPQWLKWRAKKVSEFAEQVHKTLRKHRPDILISLSPSPHPWSHDHHAADWPEWAKNEWFDEFVPQLYRDSFARVEKEWPQQVEKMGSRGRDLIAGLRIIGEGSDTPWDDLKRMIELTRSSAAPDGGGGHCWWFSRGVLEVYPKELKSLYDVVNTGPAPHPRRPADWRPPPIAGEKRGSHWRFRVEKTGSYKVIARKDGVWTQHAIRRANARSIVDITDKKYDAVELLLDRMTAAPR